MIDTTQEQPKTMQNQSNIASEHSEEIHSFYAPSSFEDSHVKPYGRLWVDRPDTKFTWLHSHNHLEIGRCVKGSGVFHIDGKVLRVGAPCYLILYEGQLHSAQSNHYDPCEWNYLYIDLRHFLSRVDTDFTSAIKGLDWQNYDFPNVMEPDKYSEIASLIDLIFNESSCSMESNDEILTGLLISLLVKHSRFMQPHKRQVPNRRVIERIAPAVTYINSHYWENVSVKTLADVCFASEATLRRDFQIFSEISPSEYLHKVRIKNAAVMLVTTNKTIIEIAMDVGYPTISSFNRKFLEYYKMPPGKYRKKSKTRSIPD